MANGDPHESELTFVPDETDDADATIDPEIPRPVGYLEGEDPHATRDPQRIRGDFRRDSHSEARRHQEYPREVGVALDVFSRIPDQTSAVHQVCRIAEADERVV